MIHWSKYWNILVFLFLSHIAIPQPEIKFIRYSTNEGLVHNDALSICQDHLGFMWFGTKGGLSRFDGNKFINFTYENDKLKSRGWINQIVKDPENNLWFALTGIEKSFLKYNYAKDSIINFTHFVQNEKNAHNKVVDMWYIFADSKGKIWLPFGILYFDPRTNSIIRFDDKIPNKIIEDNNKNLWFATSSNGVLKYNRQSKKFTYFRHNQHNRNSLSSNKCYTVYQDSNGDIWVGTNRGVNLIKKPNSEHPEFHMFIHDKNDAHSLSNNVVYDIIEDRQNNMLIATLNGLCVLGRESNKMHRYFNDEIDPYSISSNLVRLLYKDRAGGIWVATDQGVDRIEDKDFRVLSHSSYKNSISHNKVQYIQQAPDSKVWVATPVGVDVFDKGSNSFKFLFGITKNNKGLYGPPVTLYPDDEEGMFIGLWNGGICYYSITKGLLINNYIKVPDLKTERIISIVKDNKNNLWFNPVNDGFYKYNLETNKFKHFVLKHNKEKTLNTNRIRCIFQDSEQNIWLLSQQGLNVLEDEENEIFSSYLNGNGANCMLESANNHLWVGGGEGLYKIDKNTREITLYGPKQGLKGNIFGILEDNSNNLWVSSTTGLAKICLKNDSVVDIYHFRKSELNVGEFLPNSYTRLSDGSLLFGGTKGFCMFDPLTFKKNTLKPSVVFTRLKVLNQTVNVGQKINGQVILEQAFAMTNHLVLNHKNNEFSIEFAGLQYNMPQYNKYAYRLNGYDAPESGWKYTNAEGREVEYMNLPKGNYIFEVKAANKFDEWSDKAAELKITILPAWWQTSWFRVSMVVGFVLFLLLTFKLRVLNLQKQKKKLERIVIERTAELREMNYNLEEGKEEIEQQAQKMLKMNKQLLLTNSDLETKTREVEDMAKKLHEADQKQLRFFANISHEFRTPLALIIGPVEKWLHNSVGKSSITIETNYLNLIHRNSKRLLRLISEFIDIRKLDQKGITPNKSSNNIIEFIDEIANVFSPMAETKNIKIGVMSEELRMKNEEKTSSKQFFTHHSSLITQFWFDPDIMEKILYNLISNAIKYTPEGGGIVIAIGTVETQCIASLQNQLAIKISDTGIGIKPENIDKIFDRFYRVETHGSASLQNNRASQPEGTGIGLAYTKELVELHNGTISAESKYMQGTTFTLTFLLSQNKTGEINHNNDTKKEDTLKLPFIKSMIDFDQEIQSESQIQEQDVQIKDDVSDKRSQKILIVEDNADLRNFIKNELKKLYVVYDAENGEEALELLAEATPHLIISDIMMPVMDGLELCAKIKQDENTCHIPIILLTAKSGDDNIIQGLETGVDDYIVKPFNINVLKLKIKNLFAQRQRLIQAFNNSVDVNSAQITHSTFDKNFLDNAIIIVNENMLNSEFNNDMFVSLMGSSRALVYRKIKAITNQSVSEFIRNIRLKAAAKLLLEGEDNIAEVCYKVGFKHPNDFTRYFRKLFGKPPRQYIKDNNSAGLGK